MVLGNTPQTKADGRQVVGRRLPVPSGGAIGREASPGDFSERTIGRGPFEIAFLILRLERNLLQRCYSVASGAWHPGIGKNGFARGIHCTRFTRWGRGHDDDPVKRCRRYRQGTGACGRGLAGLHHRARWYPLLSFRVRQAALAQFRASLGIVIQGILREAVAGLSPFDAPR
ncbi:MAG: hypothetical protein JWP25_8862 [Bradyrhizobium sp.]|jgi:hypothetical protein|nr:hypothetical protein [Bradyrhizobium sp.]